jgi:hypothetical protein
VTDRAPGTAVGGRALAGGAVSQRTAALGAPRAGSPPRRRGAVPMPRAELLARGIVIRRSYQIGTRSYWPHPVNGVTVGSSANEILSMRPFNARPARRLGRATACRDCERGRMTSSASPLGAGTPARPDCSPAAARRDWRR